MVIPVVPVAPVVPATPATSASLLLLNRALHQKTINVEILQFGIIAILVIILALIAYWYLRDKGYIK